MRGLTLKLFNLFGCYEEPRAESEKNAVSGLLQKLKIDNGKGRTIEGRKIEIQTAHKSHQRVVINVSVAHGRRNKSIDLYIQREFPSTDSNECQYRIYQGVGGFFKWPEFLGLKKAQPLCTISENGTITDYTNTRERYGEILKRSLGLEE